MFEADQPRLAQPRQSYTRLRELSRWRLEGVLRTISKRLWIASLLQHPQPTTSGPCGPGSDDQDCQIL